ncbi:ABC transporter substrate-binding protein [Pusillimonas sp.]|uniref:ABC transporter substrate-binding protein n=1 Tax=Pusillimonas sp. TaxID=3040095 RepID=UPI0029B791C0|nr:ABC transporter substrate-binding protein [Pusillimonas sp.]MDX3895550.1 ABC transporter substrate-binding protein [Pusillimonas sp.]
MSKFFVRITQALSIAALSIAASAAYSQEKVKVGFMLPYSGTYAALGVAIENGFKLYVGEQGGKLGGREVAYYTVDDESDAAKAVQNANLLAQRDRVDVLIGSVHSGVALALTKVAKDNDITLIVPNAGVGAITGALCAPNVFRSSYTAWQTAYSMGKVAAEKGKKTAVTVTWRYAAGDEQVAAFRQGFEEGGGKVLKDISVPFPNVEFQATVTELAAAKPDAVFAFFAGAGAVKFVQDFAGAGLARSMTLYGSGFLTDGTLQAQGEAAQGLLTTLHYADGLDTPRDNAFRRAYKERFNMEPDVYAVQGYDAAQMYDAGLKAVSGDIAQKDALRQAIREARIDSPRGEFVLSKAGNPIQDIYLRQVVGQENKAVGIAIKALEDPATGCRM